MPDIKVHNARDSNFKAECFSGEDIKHLEQKVFEINTPNKLDLLKNGFQRHINKTIVLGRGTFGTVFKGTHKGM